MPHPLRDYRTRKMMSMESMAEKLGISAVSVSRIETGVRGISASMAVKIHQVTEGDVPKWQLRPDLWDAPVGAAA